MFFESQLLISALPVVSVLFRLFDSVIFDFTSFSQTFTCRLRSANEREADVSLTRRYTRH